MLQEAQIRAITIFFFYAFLEEATATQAIYKTIKKVEKDLNKTDNRDIEISIVYWSNYYWKKLRHKVKFVNVSFDGICIFSDKTNLEPWKQLQKTVNSEEFLSLIWSQILRIPERKIAEGLKVTPGTVKHRSAMAFKALGEFIENGNRNVSKRP